MSNFELPARPWGEKEIAYMRSNEVLLDNKTRVELGLKPSEVAPEAVDTPSEGDESNTPETVTPPTEEEVKQGLENFEELSPEEQARVKAEAEKEAQKNSTGSVPENTQG